MPDCLRQLRLTSLIHMLRQIRIFLSLSSSPILSRPWLTQECVRMRQFTHLASKHWAYLNIRFISLEAAQSVAARPLCGGLVFQTGFVNGTFGAGLCGRLNAQQLRKKRIEGAKEKTVKDICYHVSLSV